MTYTPNTWTNGSGTPLDATHLTNIENELVSLDTAIQTKAPLASPALTGAPTAPTPTVGDNTTKLATTAFVLANGGTGGAATSITVVPAGNITSTNVGAALNLLDTIKAQLTSPALAGVPTTPTAANGTNTTQIASTAFVLANGGGAPLASPAFTGTPTAPTATAGTNTTQLATTAFTGTAVTNATAGLALTSVIIPAQAAPTATDGADGDYWIDYSTNRLYGPKVAGAWPTYRTRMQTKIQVFTANGSYTQDVGAITIEVVAIGAGAGGGSGARGTSGTITTGGAGGGGGGFSRMKFQASDLPTSAITVTVPAGGVGGAAQTTNATAGNNGTAVTSDTTFGTYCRAQKGGSGGGGAITNTAAAGGAGGLGTSVGGSGANSLSTGAAGATAGTASGGTGAGAGGGITATPTASGGGNGTAPNPYFGNTVAAFGAVGAAGGDGVLYVANQLGSSAAGGGSSITAAGGNGGVGGIGCGGGGGGASLAGFNSGAGGNGGAGLIIVVTEF